MYCLGVCGIWGWFFYLNISNWCECGVEFGVC